MDIKDMPNSDLGGNIRKSVYDCLSPDEQRLVARWRSIATIVGLCVLWAMPVLVVMLHPAAIA